MNCTSPYRTKEGQSVPCGRCLACRITLSREWAIRIAAETSGMESIFVTLTYNDEHCPPNLVKAHVQGWLKRYRLEIGERKIKYYLCGEYGETFGRPHYHAIVINGKFEDEEIIRDTWGRGYVYISGVGPESIAYVTGYIMDKWASKNQKDKIGHTVRPFALMSKNLGLKELNGKEVRYARDMCMTYRGKVTSVPRYYIKRLKDKGYISDDVITNHRLQRDDKLRQVLEERGVDEKDYGGYKADVRRQRKEALRTQKEMMGRQKKN